MFTPVTSNLKFFFINNLFKSDIRMTVTTWLPLNAVVKLSSSHRGREVHCTLQYVSCSDNRPTNTIVILPIALLIKMDAITQVTSPIGPHSPMAPERNAIKR